MKFNCYDTLNEAITSLERRGFTTHYNFEGNKLAHPLSNTVFTPNDLKIVEYHRFENLNTTSTIFALEVTTSTKGVLVVDYSHQTKMNVFRFLDKVPVKINN